jgi:hypothetical protein
MRRHPDGKNKKMPLPSWGFFIPRRF